MWLLDALDGARTAQGVRLERVNARGRRIDPAGRRVLRSSVTLMSGVRPQSPAGRRVPVPRSGTAPRAAVATIRPGRHRSAAQHRRRLGVGGGAAAWLAGIWAAHLIYWFVVFRFHLVQGDDYLNAGMSGQPGGRTTLAQWWSSYWVDYTQVNGRATDALVRALLAPGPWLWPLLAPVLFTLVAVLLWRWAADGVGPGRGDWRSVLPGAAGASWALIAVATLPRIGGDALFWMSSTVSYVVPTALTLFVGLRLAAWLRGEVTGVGQAVVTGGAILTAHLAHEISSFTTAALVTSCWFLRGRFRDRRLIAWTVTSAVGLTAQLLAPGFWARFGAFRDGGDDRGPGVWIQAVPTGAHHLWLTTWPVLVALVALVCAVLTAAATAGRVPASRARVAAGACAGGCALAIAAMAWRALATPPDSVEVGLPLLAVSWVSGALLVGGFLAAAPLLSSAGYPECALALAGATGAALLPVALGIATVRAFLPGLLWLLAATLAAAGPALAPRLAAHAFPARLDAVSGRVPRGLAVAALAAGCAIAVPASAVVLTGMMANDERWRPTGAQLEAAARGERATVSLPDSFPRPEYLYSRAFDRERYEGYIRLYYGLREEVEVTWPKTP